MHKHTESKSTILTNRAVVFYNVENLFDTFDDPLTNDGEFTPFGEKKWDDERYKLKLDRLSEAISLIGQKPVLIGLSEVENYPVLEDLISTKPINEISFGIVHYNSPDTRGIDCALLYDKKLFKVNAKEKLVVELENDEDFKTRDILYVKGEMNSIEAHVFVNHWPARRKGQVETEHKRIRAAEVLREKVTEILAESNSANIFILGDFNDQPNNKSIHTTLRAKESGYAKKDDLINLSFDNYFVNNGTTTHDQKWLVFDQIIVSQAIYDHHSGIGVQGNSMEVLKKENILFTYPNGGKKPSETFGGNEYYGGYSDHLPVYVLLK